MIGKITVRSENPPCAYCGGMDGYHSPGCVPLVPERGFEPDQLLDVWEGDDRLEGHLPR